MLLGQYVLASVIRAHMAINIEQGQFPGLSLGPTLGELSGEAVGQLTLAQFAELSPKGLHLRHAVEAQEGSELARRVFAQLLRRLDTQ